MPIFIDAPTAESLPQHDVIRAFKPEFQTAVVDTRYTPQSDLLSYIEGSAWIVDYYSQILDTHDQIGGQDTSLPAPLQSYRRIFSMELKVLQDLSQIAVDAATGENTLQGSANVYPFLTPQVGDMFRVGMADGREGLFKVTRSDPRQLFHDRVHVIEYQLITSNNKNAIYDLDKKTLTTYYFVKDFLLNLQNPLLEEEDYHASKKLEQFYYDMTNLYMRQYFSRERMTLIVPGQKAYTYDHGLTDFVKAVLQDTDSSTVQGIRQLNVGDDPTITSLNLWTMLLARDPKLMKFISTKTGLVNRGQFHASALMSGMRYIGIDFVVYPLDPKVDVDSELDACKTKMVTGENIVSKMSPYVPPEPPTDDAVVPLVPFKPIDMNNAYVLSQAFYTRNGVMQSLLEKCLLDYLDFKIIAAKDILTLADASYDIGAVEKFYYFPLILLLIRYNLRRL